MSTRLLAILFSAAFCGFSVLGLPMSVVAPIFFESSGLTFNRASGSVWSGTLHRAALGGEELGDLQLRFNPVYLGLLRTHFFFSFDGMDGSGEGVFETGLFSYLALKNTTMRISIEKLSGQNMLAGAVYLEDVSLVLKKDGCRTAQGHLSTDVLERSASTFGWEGPVLDGTLECLDGALRVPLAGSRGVESVRIVASLFADRRYEASVTIATENPTLRQILPAFGFSDEAGVLALEQAGRLSNEAITDPLGG